MNLDNCYVSVYKICGSPILPPLMTDQIRSEMRQYKEQAMAIEKQIASRNVIKDDCSKEMEDKKVDATLDIVSNFGGISLIEKTMKDNDANKMFYKCIESTSEDYPETILTISDLHDSLSVKEFSETMSTHENDGQNLMENNQENIDCNSTSFVSELNEIEETSPKPRLIRSNSYTLDNPSPLFVQYMSQGMNIMSTSTKKTNNEIVPLSNVSTITINLPTKNVPVRQHLKKKPINKPSSFTEKSSLMKPLLNRKIKPKIEIPKRTTSTTKSAAMVYKPHKCASKEKLNASTISVVSGKTPHQCAVSGTQTKLSSKSLDSQSSSSVIVSTSTPSLKQHHRENDDKIIKFLQNFENERNAQMLDLIERQKIEQKEMHENFLRQQQLLIQQITENCSNIFANNCQQKSVLSVPLLLDDKSLATMSPNSDCSSYVTMPSITKNNTPNKMISLNIDVDKENNNFTLCENTAKKSLLIENQRNRCNRQLFQNESTDDGNIKLVADDNVKNSAATIINAYARGYLTRRLFKTDDVQNIIKIIRDTLIFILDLHQEEEKNDSEADIKLKFNLLQQLNSACYSLHDIFFTKSINEKIKIIANDRDRQHITQQKNNKSISNKSSTADNKSLNKLKKISLFPINILSDNNNDGSISTTDATNSKSYHSLKALLSQVQFNSSNKILSRPK